MPITPIQCANCGAQYRLPETFQADKAKCKKCGAQIDVAAQRNAVPAAAPPPQPARRERAPSRAPAESSTARRPAGARASSRRQEADPPSEGGRKHGARHGAHEKKRGFPVLPVVFGLLAIGGIAVVIWGLTGGDEPKHTANAPANTAETPAATARLTAMRSALQSLPEGDRTKVAAFLDASATGKADAAGLREVSDESMLRFTAESLKIAGAGDEAARLTGLAGHTTIDAAQRDAVAAVLTSIARSDTHPVDAKTLADRLTSVGSGEATPPAATPDPTAKAEAPKPETPKAGTPKAAEPPASGPVDPKALEELPWPDFVTQEERDNIMGLITKIHENSGAPRTRARNELEKLGPKVIFGIANALRGIDYHDCDEAMYGYELNQVLRAVTGKNAGYKPCAAGEVIPEKDVTWNAQCVKVWYDFAKKISSPDEFATVVKEREKKKAEEEKND